MRGDLKGQQSLVKRTELSSEIVVECAVRELAAEVGEAEGVALGEEDEAEQAEDGGGSGESGDVGGAAAVWCALLRRR